MPIDEDIRARLIEHLSSRSLDGALLSDPATITWLTGYAPPVESGPNPFEGGPALAWIDAESVELVLSDAEAPSVADLGIEITEYVGYSIDGPVTAFAGQADALRSVLGRHASVSVGGGTFGFEPDTLPASMLRAAEQALPRATWQPLDHRLARLRAVKTDREIERLRRSLALCDLAQARFREALRPDVTEIELWNDVRGAVEGEVGSRVPALVDVVAGPRAADIGGPPGPYRIAAGDPAILDVVLRLDGYWGDTAGTWFAGEPSPDLRRAYEVVRDVLQRGIDAVRPGVEARDLDGLLREGVRRFGSDAAYPHHSGHGLGTTYHDPPRLVPYESMRLEAGMVITLEPGIYLPGIGGVRLEDVVLVTSDGCEVLTTHLRADRPA